jgi:hypothetical protein
LKSSLNLFNSRRAKFGNNREELEKPAYQGVVIVAPDGELVKIGKTFDEKTGQFKNEDSCNALSNSKRKQGDGLIYRLFNEIPPYLFYTNKLDKKLTLNDLKQINSSLNDLNDKLRSSRNIENQSLDKMNSERSLKKQINKPKRIREKGTNSI